MKIYFIGMHNKLGMKPLDSKTMSGKMIDAIIKQLPSYHEIYKTNLCDVDYFVKDRKELQRQKLLWYEKYMPTTNDIIITLGAWVKKESFGFYGLFKAVINLPHPASCMGNVNKEKYLNNSINKIKTVLNQCETELHK